MMHHAPIGPSAPVVSRLLIVLASVLGVGPDAASAASPPADMPHRVADDAAGGVQPHLVLGQPARFAEGQVPTDRVPVDDPARAIASRHVDSILSRWTRTPLDRLGPTDPKATGPPMRPPGPTPDTARQRSSARTTRWAGESSAGS